MLKLIAENRCRSFARILLRTGWSRAGRLSSTTAVLLPAMLLSAALLSILVGAPESALGQDKKLPVPVHYTVVDRGPSLVRTLINTPGLNPHGDLAIWHASNASMLQGVVYRGTRSIDIAGEKDFSMVYPADINDRMTVVGALQEPQDLRFTQAFRWSDNKLEILDGLGGKYAAASAINQAGDVVGSALTVQGTRHAVLWKSEGLSLATSLATAPLDLGLLAQGDYSSARDINDSNEIVGEANTNPNGTPHAFMWHAGKMTQLENLPGGTFCSAQALNNSGEVVGSCDLAEGSAHGVLWQNGQPKDLGTLGDEDAPSTALDINASGQVVGSSEIAEGRLRAFLWQRGTMTDLNNEIAPKTGWLLLVASRINDHGEIAGRGFYHGAIHAFVLEPITTAAAHH